MLVYQLRWFVSFADGTEEKVARTETVCFLYGDEFANCGMSFEFAKAACLQYLEKKMG